MSVVSTVSAISGRADPYVTVEEVRFNAAASAIDFSQIIAEGSTAVQNNLIQQMIFQASARVDRETMGMFGTLNATSTLENGRIAPNNDGQFIIQTKFSPILALKSFAIGGNPSCPWQIPLSDDNVSIEWYEFIVTNNGAAQLGSWPFGFGSGFGRPGQRLFVKYEYVSGWANSFTTAQSAVNDTHVVVQDPTGFYPNNQVSVWDGQKSELSMKIDPSYVAGATTIPFTTPLTFKHGVGVNVSALPFDVKQACIHFVVAQIKERGQGGFVVQELGEGTAVTGRSETHEEDELKALELLDSFKAIWGRS